MSSQRNPEEPLSRISFNKYPVDIILCIAWSLILALMTFLDVEGVIRIILGLPFILFIPGYILIFALFPSRKTDRGIDIIERIALSFGLSIAVVSLIGLGLNYTPWGIRLESVLLSLFVFVVGVGAIAIYRWFKFPPDERFSISLDLSLPKSESKLDRALTIIVVISIVLAMAIAIYVIITPKIEEQFTGFYLLGIDHKAEGYPRNLIVGENATVIIGVINHEYQTINYIVEIWLINQSTYYNESEAENKTIIDHMWFVDKITTTLEHTNENIGKSVTSQWEYNFTFNIPRRGNFKLAFLLFTAPTEEYNFDKDYKDIAKQKITSAYRTTHLWIYVSNLPKISDVLATPSSTPQGGFVNISCTVFDADGVDEVYLNITDPDGNIQNFSITDNKIGDTYYCNRTYTIAGKYSYFIWTNDITGNTSIFSVQQFSVIDLPKISDLLATPSSTPQGGFVNISCTVFDADGVDEVYLNITDPDNNTQNFSITGNKTGDTYYCNRTYTVVGNYSYFIWANDINGNTNMSDVKQFYITSFPQISDLLATPSSTPQGGFVNISCTVTDADGVDEVYLNIVDPDGNIQNFSITDNKIGDTYYCNRTYTIAGEYSCFIWTNDITGNTSISSVRQFYVTDFPQITDVMATPSSTPQGGFVNISCNITDIDGIDEVYLNITDPDGDIQNFSITGNKTGDTYYCNRTYTVIGEYSYFIWVNDIAGNINMSDVKQFSVIFALSL